jgi:hypothetical protein
MGLINWRREGLFVAVAGMETCWVVGGSRVLLREQGANVAGFTWWSVLTLYILALITARTLGRMELRRASWIIGGLALGSSLLLLQANSDQAPLILRRPGDPSTAREILALMLGFLIWFRALRVPALLGDTRAITRQFQVGVLILSVATLSTLWFPAPVTDLVVAYFGLGLLAMALTRVEEVALVEPGGAAPFNLKWGVTLATTLLVAGAVALLATQVVTVEAVRWLLRPFATLLNLGLFALAVLFTALIAQLLPLLRWVLRDLPVEEVQKSLENFRQALEPTPPDNAPPLRPELARALGLGLVGLLILIALWVVVRSFRRWRMGRYATPGGVREAVAPEGSLTQDLADFMRDRWRRLRATDLRRLFRRWGTGSARAIYASLLALLAAADRPRQPEQTPYEYQPVAEEVLPAHQAEVKAITEAYVRARYGEMEASTQELAHLQEAWQRIRAEGEKLL